jgi:hypothetical protein
MQKNALEFRVWGLEKKHKVKGKLAAVPPRGGPFVSGNVGGFEHLLQHLPEDLQLKIV